MPSTDSTSKPSCTLDITTIETLHTLDTRTNETLLITVQINLACNTKGGFLKSHKPIQLAKQSTDRKEFTLNLIIVGERNALLSSFLEELLYKCSI